MRAQGGSGKEVADGCVPVCQCREAGERGHWRVHKSVQVQRCLGKEGNGGPKPAKGEENAGTEGRRGIGNLPKQLLIFPDGFPTDFA